MSTILFEDKGEINMDFEESQTKINLARAFAGECQGGARYQFIAQKAMQENKKNIQMLFKTLAKNEMAHAKLFYDYIVEKCGETCKVEFDADYPYVSPMLDVSLKNEEKIEREKKKLKGKNLKVFILSLQVLQRQRAFPTLLKVLSLLQKLKKRTQLF